MLIVEANRPIVVMLSTFLKEPHVIFITIPQSEFLFPSSIMIVSVSFYLEIRIVENVELFVSNLDSKSKIQRFTPIFKIYNSFVELYLIKDIL